MKKAFLPFYLVSVNGSSDYFFDYTMRILLIVQAIVALLLIVSILLQNRGSGLGSTFGGDFGGYYTKRGMEKFLVYATVILAIIFFVLAVFNVWAPLNS
ncbi:MAG: preprotein translocase subunit SecG [Candidatus Moranbacteria bacterium]|nr:preprotein translocase subunit SecG [Candidatus Moranbacteria bacterium]PIP25222.1 MAG: preprotein translocase subunit SecG [Candidatus Moranbacteria bacterium CG23_combo_of_CG06-09_8_20_14_all_41_28]PIV85978.1 MAG: preprotein translocase subunit SecG [Candidatus Moranbacteria bacterium CG17_big_fil_post_rev_8_21_14_2_50_41_107]PIW94401.1 MAG: preprotein translocase subunit SecG [Candidatus Moranbacteria bacterium CG_4_8_14_3_um_filter_41_13]PIX91669.1 MAG: preprotein translocase subunit Sec